MAHTDGNIFLPLRLEQITINRVQKSVTVTDFTFHNHIWWS